MALQPFCPTPQLFVYYYVRKEAVLSSQIEGTQSSLSDLLKFEQSGEPDSHLNDVSEVSRYVNAVSYGIEALSSDRLPLSLRLLKEVHAVLMSDGRGSSKADPGHFRRQQVWLGGDTPQNAVFCPPPPNVLTSCLNDFEKYLHETSEIPTLIKAALIHAQFETIHPFIDGNGRLGRLLIPLYLFAEGSLTEPLLYLSLYFKENRSEYYDKLQRVRSHGEWEEWVSFFLVGVKATAGEAVTRARMLNTVFARDTEKLRTVKTNRRASIQQLHSHLHKSPIVKAVAAALGVTKPTARAALQELAELGLLKTFTFKGTNWYTYAQYLATLENTISTN